MGFSIKHHLQMFKDSNMSIQDPSNIVKENIAHIGNIEQQISAMLLFNNWPENRATVSSISLYELAILIAFGQSKPRARKI